MTKYIVTHTYNGIEIKSEWDYLTLATLEMIRLESYGMIPSIKLVRSE